MVNQMTTPETTIEEEIERIIRRIAIEGYKRGKLQKTTPYDYTLSDDEFMLKGFKELKTLVEKVEKETRKDTENQMLEEIIIWFGIQSMIPISEKFKDETRRVLRSNN